MSKRSLLSMLLVAVALVAACGGSQPEGQTGGGGSDACDAKECGPEPPIAPSVCPGGTISTTCTKDQGGACKRHVLCNGKEAS